MKLIALAVLVGVSTVTTTAGAATIAASPSSSPGSAAAAIEPTPSPGRAVVQTVLDAAKALPATKGNPKDRRKLLDAIDNSLALDLLAEQSLGPQWGKLKQSERRKFVALLTEAFEKLAYPRAGAFLSQVTITYLADVQKPDSESVRMMISKGETTKAPLAFNVTKRGTRWQIVDVIVDGQSMAEGIAARIQDMIKAQGYPKLVAELQKRIAAADKEP